MYATTTVTPRFFETDALGHINNATLSTWFEEARRPIFKVFVPDLNPHNWNLILAHLEIDFLNQIYFSADVELKTGILKLGNSSMVLDQEAWQNGKKVAACKAVMVHFDYMTNASAPIPDDLREQLAQFMVGEEL